MKEGAGVLFNLIESIPIPLQVGDSRQNESLISLLINCEGIFLLEQAQNDENF